MTPSPNNDQLTQAEAQRLLAELPEHMADMAAFSLASGLRKAKIRGLQWSQVDLVHLRAWIHPDQAKARRAIPVPLNAGNGGRAPRWCRATRTYRPITWRPMRSAFVRCVLLT